MKLNLAESSVTPWAKWTFPFSVGPARAATLCVVLLSDARLKFDVGNATPNVMVAS
jgi:hypothetical protein